MHIQLLQKNIRQKMLPRFYIFVGSETAVMNIYIKKICEVEEGNQVSLDSVSDYISKSGKRMNINKKIFIVYEDREFLNNQEALLKLKNNITDPLILIYRDIDSRSKFYHSCENDIIKFEKLSVELLVKYIKKEIDCLDTERCKKLIQYSNNSYNQILLECDKIQHYSVASKVDHNRAFDILCTANIIQSKVPLTVFEFVDKIIEKDLKNASVILYENEKLRESTILILSLLYDNLRNLLIYKGTNGTAEEKQKKLNINSFVLMKIKRNMTKYTVNLLLYLMKKIEILDGEFKIGLCDSTTCLDYIILEFIKGE